MEEGLLSLAEQSLESRCYDAACAVFIHLLRSLPTDDFHRRSRISHLLSGALHEWGSELDQLTDSSFQLLMKAYHESLELLPSSALLLNNLGGLLFRLGYHAESLSYFQRAVAADRLFLKAHENLDNAYSNLVERWHYRMLNDSVRNSAFQRAIARALDALMQTSDKLVVLDIGTGSGILSLYAAEALQSRSRDSVTSSVYACEMSAVMSQIAVNVVSQSRPSAVIHVINKYSTELQCPADLPTKANVLITETFDCALLGESVLNTLSDAFNRLIDTDQQFVVLPEGATVYLTPVESDSIRLQNRYVGEIQCVNTDSVHIVGSTNSVTCTITNHDESLPVIDQTTTTTDDVDDDVTYSRAWEQCSSASEPRWRADEPYSNASEHHSRAHEPCWRAHEPFSNASELCSRASEPYTSEKLCRLRSGYKLLSTPSSVFKFNFNSPEEVCLYSSGSHQFSFSVSMTRCGRLDAVALWFDLHLCDDVTVTTSPQGCQPGMEQASCWEQAVYPMMHFQQGRLSDIIVYCGDVLNIHCMIESALHVKSCQLQRKYHHHHQRQQQHLDSCQCTTNMPSSELQKDQTVNTQSDINEVCHSHHDQSDISHVCRSRHNEAVNIQSDNSHICRSHQDRSDINKVFRGHRDAAVNAQSDISQVFQSHDDIPNDHNSNAALSSTQEASHNISGSHCNVKHDWFHVDRALIAQLNDVFWVESCLKALQQLMYHHQQQQQLVVLSQTPSMFPIAALRLGLVSHVCFLDLDPVYRPLIGRLLSVNGVSSDGHVTYGRPWQRGAITVLFADIVSSDGCLQQNINFESLNQLKSDGMLMMPCEVKVRGVMINSSSLLTDSSVMTSSSAYVSDIAQHINTYRMKCHVDIELSTLDYTALCDPVELLTLDFNEVTGVKGHWTNIVCVNASHSLALTAIVYWFELKLSDSVVVNTNDKQTHWTQAAVLFYDELELEANCQYGLETVYNDNCITVNVRQLSS